MFCEASPFNSLPRQSQQCIELTQKAKRTVDIGMCFSEVLDHMKPNREMQGSSGHHVRRGASIPGESSASSSLGLLEDFPETLAAWLPKNPESGPSEGGREEEEEEVLLLLLGLSTGGAR